MSNRKKICKTYVVLQNSCFGQKTIIARYLVGAKNPKDAEQILRDKVGKHLSFKTYYEEKNKFLKYGEFIKEC